MSHARDVVLVECAPERVAVRHVSCSERHPRALLLVEDEPETAVVVTEVVADGLLPVVEERLQRPRADAPERAGDERTVSQAARPGRP